MEKKEENIDQKSGKNCNPLSLSIDCASFVKYQLYIINAIRYLLGRSFHKNMFLRLCGQFLRMALLENQIEAGTLSKQS